MDRLNTEDRLNTDRLNQDRLTANRLLKNVVLAPVRLYRRYLSPLKPTPSCRFHPSCSEYAVQAVETRGVIVGLALSIWRVLRCNPFNKDGYDPVPPRRVKSMSHQSMNSDVSTEAT